MGDIGIPELLIILAIVIIVFGPARIGGVGKSLGEAIRSFRHEVRDEPAQTSSVEKSVLLAEATPTVVEDAPTTTVANEPEMNASFAEPAHAHE